MQLNSIKSLLISVTIAILVYVIASYFTSLPANSLKVLLIAVLLIALWVTQALPMPVVALLPIVLFPLTGVASVQEVATPYANSVIFLFLGGFIIGLAIEKWHLHKRIALNILRLTGSSGNNIVAGFIIATGFLSMWLSNTATTMMMYPIALSVIHVLEETDITASSKKNIAIALLLCIAYASNFGGIATIIGTPPNVAYIAFIEKEYHYTIQFTDWLLVCLPVAILLMLTLYYLLTKWLLPTQIIQSTATENLIKQELIQMGKMSTAEKRVTLIFGSTAMLWITKDLLNSLQTFIKLDDTIIALAGAITFFAVPAKKAKKYEPLLVWSDTQKMAWGILLLFGGGITLANQLEKAELINIIASIMAKYAGSNLLVLVFIITLLSIFLSEVMSNVAQVIVFAPVLSGFANELHINPLVVGMPMVLAASAASMLPMGTPPNAIVFASGKIPLPVMMKTGFLINVAATFIITVFCYYVLPFIIHSLQ